MYLYLVYLFIFGFDFAFRGWEAFRAELISAFELLFEEGPPLPRSLSEIRIDITGAPAGGAPCGPPIAEQEEEEERRREHKERGRRCRCPEFVFGILNPQLGPSAAPRRRVLAEEAFLSVAEE